MKKTVYSIAVATMVCLASCGYNDDDVWNAINSQEERITALENWQKTINENIAALQALVNENDYITDVTPIVENGETTGYIISFFKQGSITIYNGTKGDKGETGDTPSIGVTKQEDGKYYWTLNGELLKDAEGNPICASGQDGEDGKDGSDGSNGSSGTSAPTPQIKLGKDLSISQDQYGSTINDEDVCLSVDGGKTWVKISGTGSDNIFASAPVDNGAFWTFPLSNGTEINVPKYIHLLLYSVIGNEEKLISNAELKVNEGQEFSILCRPADGCKWSYQVRDSKNNWEITKTENGLNIKAGSEGTSIILLFTLTTPDNQAYFYQVTVETVKNAIIQKEDNAALAQALAQVLPGVTLDSEGNATITQETIDNTSSLYLSGRQLTSLEGLDCFVNLTSLDCSQNQLTEIDGSQLPQSLTQLYCSGNNLQKFDISTLKELTYLDCSGCFSEPSRSSYSNGTLDLSNHPNLEYLYCGNNNLQTLDVTLIPKLKTLNCDMNNLTKLDLSNNPNLEILFCNNNKLQTLDITQNLNLESFSITDNNLTELKLGNNTKLSRLNCCDNRLKELDLSQYELLYEFYANRNEITHLILPEKSLLRIIGISSNSISDINVSTYMNLIELDCSINNLKSLDVSHNPELDWLACDENQMYTLDISHNDKMNSLRCGDQHKADGTEQSLVLTVNEEQVALWENNWQYNNYNVTISDQVIDIFGGNSNDFTNGGVY